MAELTITPKAAPTATTKPSKKRGKADAIEITFPKYDEVKPYNKCGFDLTDKDKTTLKRSNGPDGSYILTIEHPPVSQMQGAIIDQMTEYCALDGETGTVIGGQIDSHTAAGEKKVINYYTCDQKDECDPTNIDAYIRSDINLKPSFKDGKLVRVSKPKEEDEAKVRTEAQ